MVRLCGASLGLLAFSVAIVQGLLAGNPVEVVVVRAVWALAVFCVLGLVTGWMAFRVLEEHERQGCRATFPEAGGAEAAADRRVVPTEDGQGGSDPGEAEVGPANSG